MLGQRAQDLRHVSGHRGDLDVLGGLRRGIDDVGDLSASESAEAQPKVERSSEHDDQIGALLQQTASAQKRKLVIGGQAPRPSPLKKHGTRKSSTAARSSAQAPLQ